MKPVARYCTVLSSVIAALSLGCVDTQQTAGLRPLALDKSAADAPNACLEDKDHDKKGTPVVIVCAIPFPGTAVASVAKGWTDHEAKAYYVNDQTNKAVDVIDTRTYAFAGRVPGFVGAAVGGSGGTITYGGGTAASNGQGPNSMVPTHAGILWVSDGNSTVQVVDVGAQAIIASVNTALPACDGNTPTTHYCGRVNEMTYDSDDQIVLVENPNPLDLTYCTTAGNNCNSNAAVTYPTAMPKTLPPYASFISAKPPYPVLGHVSFPDAKGTTEAPVWVQKLHRFLVPVPTCSGATGATACAAATGATQYIAVVDPGTMSIEKTYSIPDCAHLMPGLAGGPGVGMINDLSIDERDQHVLMPVCGKGNLVFDAQTGDVVNVVTEISSSDETWFNPGDGNFYVTAVAPGGAVPGPASSRSLGVIDGKSGKWRQNVLDVGGNIGAALSETNRIFTTVTASTGTSACTPFGFAASGCVIVFEHEGKTDK